MHAYEAMQEPAPNVEGLKGRTIVLDAGHGGGEPGAVGPNGLREKDVNLAVARSLAKRLEEAGAKVVMTRDGDYRIATESLPVDLKARANIANTHHADLFLSIHHNATLDPNNKLDETETFYKMEDVGPSLDAGRAIHDALSKNLALPKNALFPGNYAVLRNCQAPAVLGEASYLSHPYFEKLLGQQEKTELEAQAYFNGIAHYFAQGTPRATLTLSSGNRPTLSAVFSEAVAKDSIRFLLDDQPVSYHYDEAKNTLTYQPEKRLSNGTHHFQVQARGVLGNSTPIATASAVINASPAHLEVKPAFPIPPMEGPMPVIAKILDADGLPVADGTRVDWKADTGAFMHTETSTKGGNSTNYVVDVERFPVTGTATAGKVHGTIKFQNQQEAVLLGQVMDPLENPISGAKVKIGKRLVETNEDGYFWVYPFPEKAREMVVEAPGYRRHSRPIRDPEYQGVVLSPLFSQPFPYKLLMLHPMGGWRSYKTAEYLKQYLEKAGAKVVISHTPDEPRDDQGCVRTCNHLGADLFIGIGDATASIAEHYPASVNGKRLGDRLGQLLSAQVNPSSSYPLIHTACTGINVRFPQTELLSDLQMRAYRVFLALAPENPRGSNLKTLIKNKAGAPISGAILLLDGDWAGQSDSQGNWNYENLSPGNHCLTVSEGPLSRTFWVNLEEKEQKSLEIILDRQELPADLG